MRKSVSILIGMAVAVALAGTACSDISPTAPAIQRTGSASSNLLGLGGSGGGLLGTLTSLLIPPVHRTTPLPADVTWSFTAGPDGATSSNSAVGLTIVIPSGALSSTETITVTALAGAPVAYGFYPHLTFAKKVSLTQDLAGTDVTLLGSLVLSGAHFDTGKATFKVRHFSGWIVASGVGEEEGGAY